MSRVVIVEDDPDVRHALCRTLRGRCTTLLEAGTAAKALAIVAETTVDVVVLDLGLPDGDGISPISALLRVDPACRVVVLTGRDDARAAVGALRAGASDYLTKPFERNELFAAMDHAFEEATVRREVLKAKLAFQGQGFAGISPLWMNALEEVRALAERSQAPVILLGESGTGKEVLARLLHRWSPRAAGPFVTANAACLPAPLLESELFGHEVGAFTDARSARQGLFELAHRGTLFIDEIGELQFELQSKLLRVLEGHPFRRVGGQREIVADVRVVSATNRDLRAMVTAGTFREDLYFRVGVLQLSLPPLRERVGDVRELTARFLASLSGAMGIRSVVLGLGVLTQLEGYPWPGNVRELRNVIERALVLSRGGDIELRHLPPEIAAGGAGAPAPRDASIEATAPSDLEAPLKNVVRRHILEVYEAHAHNVTHTAKTLQMSRVALRRHLRQYLTSDGRPAK